MIELLSYGFMQRALLAALLIGIASGLIGPYVVLRKVSLIGEGLAHLAFAGIALAFLFGSPPMITALIVVILGSLLIRFLIEKNLYGDAAIALILSLGVGTGIIIIGATKGFGVDIFSYLIGSILLLSWMDILLLSILCLVIIIFLVRYRRELFLLTFQKDIAYLSFKQTKFVDYLFSILIAFVVLMSIQAVGILLVTALLVIPSLIALRLAKSFKQTLVYGVLISTIASLSGIIISFYLDLPTSGVIVLVLIMLYALSFLHKRL